MTRRSKELGSLLAGLESVISSAMREEPLGGTISDVFRALRTPTDRRPEHRPERLPACEGVADAISRARSGNPEIAEIADTFEKIEPLLSWRRRAGSETAEDPAFHDGHANALIIGPNGLEERADIWIGVSLMSPNVQYPVHRHPPEEIYVVLSPGEWKKGDEPWHVPGIGGLVHNPPGTIHSMRSANAPLLAFWLLWSESRISL
ncbi:transcriptional regulator [Pseudaminobacter sp. 19-2017]|uniref:Transcriptional regulator n=1 Tax=Pseudaminobacter soli (ex Zhang et al. 2022) TaxID=2831468 RepID=A0A942I7L7_9HYPH|nr:dimethylsulfonioproprionate lyase family protein [Pseudaminobacter soli]MBS3648515.1 transcriptional regulator [Pseudaminobacter soli]